MRYWHVVWLVLAMATCAEAQVIPSGTILLEDEGVPAGPIRTINCVGAGITCTRAGLTGSLTVTGAPAGTVSGTGTDFVFPIWTNGPGSVIGDSVFQQNTSAIVKAGSTAAVGGIGFNNAGNVEVIADGSTVVNAGLFNGAKSDFTIHDSTNENNNQFLMYNDSEGMQSGVVTSIYGTYPSNTWQLAFGDGAGALAPGFTFSSIPSSVLFGPSVMAFASTNFQFSAPASGLITSPSGGFVYFDVSGTPSAPNGFSHTFKISNVSIPESTIAGASTLGLFQQDGTTSLTQFGSANNAGTAVAGIKGEIIGNAASSTKAVTTLEVQDATGDVSLNLFSPTNNSIATGIGTLSLNTTQTGAGTAPYMFFPKPGGGAGLAIHAADSYVSTVFLTWPNVFPSSNGQALVATTAGAMSWSSFVSSATGTANQITVSASTGAVTWSLPSAVTMPGSLTVTTRTGTPATMAVFTSGGVLAETTLPSSGTVTSIATTSPITGGTITTTGTIACATCVTAASALTSGHLVAGAGGQATAITDLTGDATTSGGVATTVGKVNGVTYPASPSTNTVPVVTGTNTITYEAVPNAALANSSVTVNGTTCTLGSSCSPSAAATSVVSWTNAAVAADWGGTLLTMSSTLTVRYAQYVLIPFAITVNQISVAFGPVTTPGTFKECVYSADGSSKLIDITVTPAAATLVSGAVSAVTVGPGAFWFVIGGATTNSGVQIRGMAGESGITALATASRPSGKTVWHGTVSHTSGTCNSTLGTVTGTSDVIPNFVFDN